MASSSSSSSLILPFLSPKSSMFLSKPTTKSSPSSLFFNSFSLKTTTTPTTNNKSFSISSAFNSERSSSSSSSSSSSYNKSATSEFNQEEEVVVSSGRTDFNSDLDELKLYVGNLSVNVDSDQLVELFKGGGNVQMAKVIYDKMTGKSRGFAFVHMSTIEEAKAAAKKFHGYKIERKEMNVQYGTPPPPPPSRDNHRSKDTREGVERWSSARCYVGNLALNVDDEVLMTLFDVPGKVLEARVVYDRGESGRSMGFGFITYGSYQEVENAISSLNGFELNGKKIRVCAAKERQRLA